jgi:hypothetical protein
MIKLIAMCAVLAATSLVNAGKWTANPVDNSFEYNVNGHSCGMVIKSVTSVPGGDWYGYTFKHAGAVKGIRIQGKDIESVKAQVVADCPVNPAMDVDYGN